jgi:hypothetical protein
LASEDAIRYAPSDFIASQSESFCYTYVGDLKMAAPSEEKLICDKFNLEALTVNQVKVSNYEFSLLHIFSLVIKPSMSAYITNLVCYAYFHWLFNPECQHIFGKQTD